MHKIMLFWCLCCCCSCSCYSSLFWSEGAQCHDKWKNPKCTKLCIIYSETTGYYEKCSCFVKRCFLQTQCKCNETFIIEWIKTWKIMNILLFENSVRPILLFSAWIIIASWTYCWKYFVLFFFCHLNWVRNLHLGGYTAYIIHP